METDVTINFDDKQGNYDDFHSVTRYLNESWKKSDLSCYPPAQNHVRVIFSRKADEIEGKHLAYHT